MKVEDINWDNYDNKAIEFILKESDSLVQETFKSLRELTNRCYYAIGLYGTFLSYCFAKISSDSFLVSPYYYLMFAGLFVSIFLIFKNLLPGKMIYPGTQPVKLLIPEIENAGKESQLFELQIQTIVASNNAFDNNRDLIDRRQRYLVKSVKCFLLSLIISICCLFLFQSQRYHILALYQWLFSLWA